MNLAAAFCWEYEYPTGFQKNKPFARLTGTWYIHFIISFIAALKTLTKTT